MTNTQLYLTIGVPFLTFLITYIVTAISNRTAIQDLRTEMRSGFADLRTEMRSNISDLRLDLGSRMDHLDRRMDRIENRMDRIEKRLDTIDTEIRVNHDSRLAVLEARVLGRAG